MKLNFWQGDYSIRIDQVAALKASDRIYKVSADFYEEGTNFMKIALLDNDRRYDGIEIDRLVHENLKNDSRPLTEKERQWVNKKLGVKEEENVEISY